MFTMEVNTIKSESFDKDVSRSDPVVVKEAYESVVSCFRTAKEIHARYVQYREEGSDTNAETAAAKEDEEWSKTLFSKFQEITNLYNEFKESWGKHKKEKEKLDSVESLERENKSLKAEYDAIMKIAEDTIKATSDARKRTAEENKKNMKAVFASLKENYIKKREVSKAKNETEEVEMIDGILDKEQAEVLRVEQSLNEITKEMQKKDLPSSSSLIGGRGAASNLIKIEKPKAPTFDMKARNFASFKKEFMSMVAVPGRAANDIGYQLKNAIPEKNRYLLANVDINDYKEMMTILERKFGGGRKVVDAAVSDLEKLKTPATDKEFVKFVEMIESIHRDLEALDLVAEVANASVISKIEARLPPLVKTKWAEKHVEEEFSDKTSTEVFTELMKFLEKNKRSAEYIVSCLLYTSPSPRD